MTAQPHRLAVAPGDRFPSLDLRTCRDRPSTIQPQSAIVIFYRGQWCGHCREQIIGLAHEIDTFRALNVSIIAISADDFVGANDMCLDSGGVIDILFDPAATSIQQFGLADRDEMVDHIIARPAVYVVDADGIVRYRYLSRTANDRPTSALLALAAESLSRPVRKESTTA
ncbi:MAG: peroxiredoxin family protein [Chloroflexota bacterium]|nr:peroxiredoxin family protein [Chloroflexota bacterium]